MIHTYVHHGSIIGTMAFWDLLAQPRMRAGPDLRPC